MAETKRDDNLVPTLTGVLNTDGATPTRVKINQTSHALATSDGSTGSDAGKDVVARDNSGVPVAAATDADGNLINLYVDSSGNLLIQST